MEASCAAYAATTVDQICAATEVTKGAFFHHFPSKEAMAVELLERYIDPKNEPQDRRWFDVELDLLPWSGKQIDVFFETDSDVIKSAFRSRAFAAHPDRNPDNPEAEEKFKELSEAYAVLSDPQKRNTYDQFGHAGLAGAGQEPQPARFRLRAAARDFRRPAVFRVLGGRQRAGARRDHGKGALALHGGRAVPLRSADRGRTRVLRIGRRPCLLLERG